MPTATTAAVADVEDSDAQNHYEEDNIRYVEIHLYKSLRKYEALTLQPQ